MCGRFAHVGHDGVAIYIGNVAYRLQPCSRDLDVLISEVSAPFNVLLHWDEIKLFYHFGHCYGSIIDFEGKEVLLGSGLGSRWEPQLILGSGKDQDGNPN